jgi:drug/metabolite transporter (DMT)-like permease
MLIGVIAGLLAGALWGLTFIAPHVVAPYTPFDLTIVRFVFYALASWVLLQASDRKWWRKVSGADWQTLVLLGFTGNTGYYLAMASAVPMAGTTVVALIIGALPVALALAGRRGSGAIALRELVLPLSLIAIGLTVINGEALLKAATPASRADFALGIALTLAALALWTWYGLANDRALDARPQMTAATWAALTGLGTALSLVPVAVIGPLIGLSNVPALGLPAGDFGRLLLWGAILGVLASWAATWAWAIASQRLPVSLTGQLIVSETLFALVYGFFYEGRWPSVAEAIGAALLIAGVVSAIRTFSRQQATSSN